MNSSSALRILGCIITLSPWWAIEASLDMKHTAESRPAFHSDLKRTTSTASASSSSSHNEVEQSASSASGSGMGAPSAAKKLKKDPADVNAAVSVACASTPPKKMLNLLLVDRIKKNPHERQYAFRATLLLSSDPKDLFQFIPKEKHELNEHALKRCFFGIKDTTMQEYRAYQAALGAIQQKRMQRFGMIHQAVSDCMNDSVNFDPKVAMITAQMLYPAIGLQTHKEQTTIVPLMHPELENAITSGNDKRFDELAAAGWLTDDPNNKGLDALSLAVHHGQLEILKKLIAQVPFVSEQRKNALKRSAEKQAEYYREQPDEEARQKLQAYQNIAQLIDTAWPNKEKDNALSEAFYKDNAGAFLEALEKGASPNSRADDQKGSLLIYLALFNPNPVFLKMLVDTKKIDPQATPEISQGLSIYSLPVIAIGVGRSIHLKLLLDAGFDLNAAIQQWVQSPEWKESMQSKATAMLMSVDNS